MSFAGDRVRTVESFPHTVRELEHVEVPMSDGTRLAARIWLPDDAASNPVPAILEYIPYRKRDGTARRDSLHHPWFAGHGYGAVRVDLRGSGDSEGVLRDEYLDRELTDGEEVLRWLARQPWCDGRVGMMGISWGGFNALQIAARRPPELEAIITVCSTDDRYRDDVHYQGGCLLGDNLSWASTMFSYNSLPPDPALVGDRWRDMWRERLEGSGLWLDTWLRHPWRDDYWKWGSVCEDYSAIRCPVLAVSGWADGYSNAVFRLMEGLDAPRLGIVGPWAHRYPHLGTPGPAIGFLQEALRWWDRWLKGVDTGIMREPMLRIWRQDTVSPFSTYEARPGAWIGEETWPSDRIRDRPYHLAPNRLLPGPPSEAAGNLEVCSPLSLGIFGGKWCSYGGGPDLPTDQRLEDGGALVFQTDPLDAPLDVVGRPVAELDLAADRPVAMVAVRLSEVLPTGEATRITYGLLNLTHRDGHEAPAALEAGRRYPVTVRLNGIAQRFSAGSRLRLSISSSYWPIAWLPPELATLRLRPGSSRLVLPERPVRGPEVAMSSFGEPEAAPITPTTRIRSGEQSWTIRKDLARDTFDLDVINDDGVFRFDDTDLEWESRAKETYSVVRDEPDSARGETRWVRRLRRGKWNVETVTHTVLTCTPESFHLSADLDAREDGRRVYCRSWHREIPRMLV